MPEQQLDEAAQPLETQEMQSVHHDNTNEDEKPTSATVTSISNDCLPLTDFGDKRNRIPTILEKAGPLLFAKLEHQNWLEMIGDALKFDFSSAAAMRNLFNTTPVEEFSLQQLLLTFYWFFRGVHNCNGDRRFIERALDNSQCMEFFI